MSPHDAAQSVAKLQQLFEPFPPAQCEALSRMLEKFSLDAFNAALPRYTEETTTFDRAKLYLFLSEEHKRRARRVSDTGAWKETMEAELRERDELLSKTPKRRLEGAVEEVRKKPISRFLHADPLETDFGKWLIFNELKAGHRN